MKHMLMAMLGSLALFSSCECMSAGSNNSPAVRHALNKQEQDGLDAWLGSHPHVRYATVEDCKCQEDVEDMRKLSETRPQQPDYNPYMVVGDFNGDGAADFAVVLIDGDKPTGAGARRHVLLVFNGPFNKGAKAPAFEANVDMADYALFYFPPRRNEQWRPGLAVAPFSADVAFWLVPRKNSYDMKPAGEE